LPRIDEIQLSGEQGCVYRENREIAGCTGLELYACEACRIFRSRNELFLLLARSSLLVDCDQRV
jgi:hypothetical protein